MGRSSQFAVDTWLMDRVFMDGPLILHSTCNLWCVCVDGSRFRILHVALWNMCVCVCGWTVDSAVYKRLVERGWMDC